MEFDFSCARALKLDDAQPGPQVANLDTASTRGGRDMSAEGPPPLPVTAGKKDCSNHYVNTLEKTVETPWKLRP